jgi:surface antigen
MSKKIADIAKSYIGQLETKNNSGFVEPVFEMKMKQQGFYKGAPWCAFFTKLVWREGGQDVSLMNGSAWRTALNLQMQEHKWEAKPVVGALVVWRSFRAGKQLSTGHIGIVTDVDGTNYSTVEGNTTDKGGREGIMVAIRHRHLTKDKFEARDGLRLMGFVYPK